MIRQLTIILISLLVVGCIASVSVSLCKIAAAQETNNYITAFDFSASADNYATAHKADWTVRIWDASNNQLLHTVQVPDFRTGSTVFASINSLVFSPSGDRLAIGPWGDIRGLILIVDTSTGETLLEIVDIPPVTAIKWSPDGRFLAGLYDYSPLTESESFDYAEHFVALWDVATGEELKCAISGVSPESLDWSLQGNSIIFPDSIRGIIVWDVESWQELYTLPAHGAISVAWHPIEENTFAYTGTDGVLRIWNENTSSLLREINAASANQLTQKVFWSQDGKWVGVTKTNRLQIWDADTGTLVFSYEAMNPIHGIALLVDGSILLGSGDTVEKLEMSISPVCMFTAPADPPTYTCWSHLTHPTWISPSRSPLVVMMETIQNRYTDDLATRVFRQTHLI